MQGRPWLARRVFAAAQDPVSGFPFMVQMISLTARALQALRLGALTPLCNARAAEAEAEAAAAAPGPVLRAFDDFYAGLALAFVEKWRESGATIARMGHIMLEVGGEAHRAPERCVASMLAAQAKAECDERRAAGAGAAEVSFSRF